MNEDIPVVNVDGGWWGSEYWYSQAYWNAYMEYMKPTLMKGFADELYGENLILRRLREHEATIRERDRQEVYVKNRVKGKGWR